MKICYVCKRELPLDAFLTITVRDKRCKPGHSWTGPSSDCRECRNEQRRAGRQKKAEAAGKAFTPRGDRAAWQERQRAVREQRKAEGMVRLAAHHATQKAQAEERRRQLAFLAVLECRLCGRALPRSDFHASELRICKTCVRERDAAKARRDSETLSDEYVMRLLTKYTKFPRSLITAAMLEAKRLQLMIDRAVPTEADRYSAWLTDALRDGPMDATQINKLAETKGFAVRANRRQFRRARRVVGAVYDEATNTWRIE